MNNAEKDHLTYLELIENEHFRKNIERLSKQMSKIEPGFINLHPEDHGSGEIFLKWIQKQNEFNYYIAPNFISEGGIMVFKRDYSAFAAIALCNTVPLIKKHFKTKDAFNLEIKTIHSLKKGEGYKMMKKIILLAEKMNVPIDLWTETEELVHYYERYGFENCGKVGDKKENLMILYPGEGKY